MSNSLQPHGLWHARLLRPWDFPGKNTGVGCCFLLQELFLTAGSNPHLRHWQPNSLPLSHRQALIFLGVLSRPGVSDASVILGTVARQAPLSMGLFRQEHWSGLLFPSPGDLHNPGIKPESPVSPDLHVDS